MAHKINNEVLTVTVNDLEEMEVDTSFLTYNAFATSEGNLQLQVPSEWRDRLLMNPVDLPVPVEDPLGAVPVDGHFETMRMAVEDPVEIVSVNPLGAVVQQFNQTVNVSQLTESTENMVQDGEDKSALVVLPVASCPSTHSSSNSRPAGRLSIPAKYLDMPFDDFVEEMEQSIYDIVQESISLFQRDPWEYHPFYLRVFKYITIGQRLGYLSENETQLNKIWESFFNFAKRQFELSKVIPFRFMGEEKSPYAIYLLTKKVVIDGKTITTKKWKDDNERLKQFRGVESAAKRIRSTWLASSCFGEYIRENLQAKLDFFHESKMMSYPTDCLKMNNIWSKFLSKDGFYSKIKKGGGTEDPSMVEPTTGDVSSQQSTSTPITTCKQKETEDQSKKSLRELIINIMAVPSTSCFRNVTQPSILASLPIPQISQSSSLPNNSPFTPLPEDPTVKSSQTTNTKKVPTADRLKSKRKQPRVHFGHVKPSLQQSKENPSKGASKVFQTKKKLIGKLLATKKTNTEAQQMKLEKMLFQTHKKLSNASIKTKAKAKSTNLVKSATVVPSSSSCQLSTTNIKYANTKKAKISSKKIIKNVPVESVSLSKKGLSSSVLAPKKKSVFHQLKRRKMGDCKEQMQTRLEMMIVTRKVPKNVKRKPPKLETTMATTVNQNVLPAETKMKDDITAKKSKQKIKSNVKIQTSNKTPNAKAIILPAKKRKDMVFSVSPPVLFDDTTNTRIIEHDSLVHIPNEQLAREEGISPPPFPVSSYTAVTSLPPATSVNCIKTDEYFTVDTPCDKPSIGKRQQMCTECGNYYDQCYIPVHMDTMHNPNRRYAKCPICDQKLAAAKLLWHHYCQYHLSKSQSLFDPYAPLMMAQQPNKSRTPAAVGEPTISTCEICGKTFSSYPTLTRHLYYVHGDGLNRDNYVQCEFCEKKFKKKDVLDEHIRRIHKGTVKSKCFRCGNRDFQSSGKLWKHLVDFHGESASEAAAYCEVAIVVCVYCGMELLQDRQYGNHVKAVHPEHLEEFLVVQQKYSSDGRLLTRAEKKRELRKKFRETGIGPAWIKKDAQRSKRKVQTPESIADAGTCLQCNKHIPEGLAHHNRVEHGIIQDDREVYCVVAGCKARFYKRTNMRIHVRTCHMDNIINHIANQRVVKIVEKTAICTVYQCTMCGEYMHHTEEVKAHMVHIHDTIFESLRGITERDIGELTLTQKEFPCPHCSSKYPSDEEVRMHAEQDHPDLCWHCPQCSTIVLDPADLTNHFQQYHNDNDTEEIPKDGEVGGYMTLKVPSRKLTRGGFDGEKRNTWDALRMKHGKVRVNCEICGQQSALRWLHQHIQRIHGIEEDLEMVCEYCTPHTVYTSCTKTRRVEWLCHLEKNHSNTVNIEDKIALATRVLTKVDWKTLDIQNPNGRRKERKVIRKKEKDMKTKKTVRFTPTKPKKKKSKEIETSEDSEFEKTDDMPLQKRMRLSKKLQNKTKRTYKDDFVEEVAAEVDKSATARDVAKEKRTIQTKNTTIHRQRLKGNRQKPIVTTRKPKTMPTLTGDNLQPNREKSLSLRVSTRKRKTPVRYESANDSDFDDETGDPEGSTVLARLSICHNSNLRRTATRRTVKTPLVRQRSSDMAYSLNDAGNDKSELSNLQQRVEQHKRLVISVVRLTVEEISKHLSSKCQNIIGKEGIKVEQDVMQSSILKKQDGDGEEDEEMEWIFRSGASATGVPTIDPLSF